jgi:hypothetical protein
MKSRRELLLLTAGAAGLAGCSGGQGGSPSSETPNDTETSTPTDTPTETVTATEEPAEATTEEPENREWEASVRNGVPLNGLGAYLDRVLEAGPVRETKASEIQQILEESNNLDEEIDAMTQVLTNEEVHSYMAEYHRQKQDKENQIVVNKNWSFTSQSEPILELYKITDGNLQSQPTILDHDPKYNSRNINKPNSEEPDYLAAVRNDEDDLWIIPQDYDAIEKRFSNVDDKHVPKLREAFQEKWSNGLFGLNGEHNIIPHDPESSNIVFDGLYQDGDTQAVVELNNKYRDSEAFESDNLVSAEYTGEGWEFREHKGREIGDPLPGEDDFFELVE